MRRARDNGFALVLAIAILALIGTVMIVLTEDAKTLLFESNEAYLQAVQRNLAASGRAWAIYNIEKKGSEIAKEKVDLDVKDIGTKDSNLTVIVNKANDKESEIQISISCGRERRTLRKTQKYTL